MSDIHCPKCGEPWDMYELHDAPGLTYDEARRAFVSDGCAVFDSRCGRPTDSAAASAAVVAMTMSPHPDDWTSLEWLERAVRGRDV